MHGGGHQRVGGSWHTCNRRVDLPTPGSPPMRTIEPGTTPPPSTRPSSAPLSPASGSRHLLPNPCCRMSAIRIGPAAAQTFLCQGQRGVGFQHHLRSSSGHHGITPVNCRSARTCQGARRCSLWGVEVPARSAPIPVDQDALSVPSTHSLLRGKILPGGVPALSCEAAQGQSGQGTRREAHLSAMEKMRSIRRDSSSIHLCAQPPSGFAAHADMPGLLLAPAPTPGHLTN